MNITQRKVANSFFLTGLGLRVEIGLRAEISRITRTCHAPTPMIITGETTRAINCIQSEKVRTFTELSANTTGYNYFATVLLAAPATWTAGTKKIFAFASFPKSFSRNLSHHLILISLLGIIYMLLPDQTTFRRTSNAITRSSLYNLKIFPKKIPGNRFPSE